jgi:hypothetical protein
MRKILAWSPFILSGVVLAANMLLNIPNLPTVLGLPLAVWLIGSLLIVQIIVLAKQISDMESVSPNVILANTSIDELKAFPEIIEKYGGGSALSDFIMQTNSFLFCVDFVNKPKVPKDNPARGVQALIQFFDLEGKKVGQYYGRWIGMPEDAIEGIHRYTDIPPDGHTTRRLGIAAVQGGKGNDFILLDGNRVSSDVEFVSSSKIPAGEYPVIVTISGSNFSEPPVLKLTIKNSRNELSIYQQKR